MRRQPHQPDHMQIICISIKTNHHTSISSLRSDAISDAKPMV